MGWVHFIKRRLGFNRAVETKDSQVKVWMRMGVIFVVSADEAKKILNSDSDALDAAMRGKKSWFFDGDSYIPDVIVQELCEELGLDYKDYKGEVNFDVSGGEQYV